MFVRAYLRVSKIESNVAMKSTNASLALGGPKVCSGQLIPDSILSFSSAITGGMPSLKV